MRLLQIASAFLIAYNTMPAYAGGSQGPVRNILTIIPDVLIFSAGTINSAPSCNTTGQWAISMSDPVGKPMLATLLAAQAQNKQVFVYGYTNTCRDWGDRELPSYLMIVD